MGKLYSLITALLLAGNAAYAAAPVGYEYWLDDNYGTKTTGEWSEASNSYNLDLNGFRRGLHRFNYRLATNKGEWGAVYTKYFYIDPQETRFTGYEYWLDNDYANHVSATATANSFSLDIDLSGFDKTHGAHFFNLRACNGDGEWSPVYRKLLIFTDPANSVPVVGYRHYLNGADLGYVEVERQVVESYMFDIDLPDSIYPSLKNRKPTFIGDRVSIEGTDIATYTLQVCTELGWGAPKEWKFEITNDFHTTAVAMEVDSKRTFASPTDLEFAAVKFTAPGNTLYFRSDAPISLDLYKGGEKKASVAASDLQAIASLDLEAGEYFGLLHGIEDPTAENFTFELASDENSWNSVDSPELADGGLVVETPAPGTLKISSDRERSVAVATATGVILRTLHLQAGESVVLEGLTKDLYIISGVKVIVK